MWYSHEAREQGAAARDPLPAPVRAPMPPETPALWPGFTRYLSRRDLSVPLARSNGWYPSDRAGDRAPRVVIPCTASEGHTFWQARALEGHEPRYQSPHHARRDALVWVWPDARALQPYGLMGLPGVRTGAVIAEGPMDALAAAGEGWYGVAVLGATPPEEVLVHLTRLLVQRDVRRVVVMADADLPGSLLGIAFRLAAVGIETQTVVPAPHKDFADVPRKCRQGYLPP